ncbi:MAG: hypothetical protein H0X44_01120 [Acidobacteria bacterium]|nr:hypothetical protein [Acidobacteriota bacterium]
MTSILALTLAATLAQPARPALAVQMKQLVARSAPTSAAPAPGAAAVRRGDSLWNGAITGALVGGVSMAAYASRTCDDATCIAPVAFWTAISAGIGAAVGIGIDALFDR